MTIEEIYIKLPTQDDCLSFLEDCYWNNVPKCPYCESKKQTPLKKQRRYHCKNCISSYSVTVRTMFHNTKMPLQKWFRLIYIINSGEFYSSRQLGRDIKVTKDTVLRMRSQVNKADVRYSMLVENINKRLI